MSAAAAPFFTKRISVASPSRFVFDVRTRIVSAPGIDAAGSTSPHCSAATSERRNPARNKTPAMARLAARREAGGIIARLEKGETSGRPGADSPSATGPTIVELAEQYMTDHVAVRCKPTTA